MTLQKMQYLQRSHNHRLHLKLRDIIYRSFGVRHKVTTLEDAVAVVRPQDSICVSGFVTQGCPEALCRALGNRFRDARNSTTNHAPDNLKLIFGGGPGDFATRGLNHFAQNGMLSLAIGAHYGQVPALASAVLANKFPAFALPLGCISRMIRATASHTPGHFSQVGLGTFVDPVDGVGGALNDAATNYSKSSHAPLVSRVTLDSEVYLRYRQLPINVAFIRATTADTEGNLTLEHESLLIDSKVIAMATRATGGIVIAQVERIVSHGSLNARKVDIPGIFVDCVVQATNAEEHWMSFQTSANPSWTGEIKTENHLEGTKSKHNEARRIIARRAAMELRPDDVVNLGIGMPEGVATVAAAEGIYKYMTFTTEPGVIGGVAATGHEFGPAENPEAFLEMNQQFDLYNGGGLSVAFLGLAACDPATGDVNVSRLTSNSLTGPGGFMDIVQSTRRIVFLGTFMKKGLSVSTSSDNQLRIERDGCISTFNDSIMEVTFAAKNALANGQQVLYITERCVFELNYRGLKLVEIAPGVDLDRDILDHIESSRESPIYVKDRNKIPLMDSRLFKFTKTEEDESDVMGLYQDLFSIEKQFHSRLDYQATSHTLFIDLKNVAVVNASQISTIESLLSEELKKRKREKNGEGVNIVANYDGFDCKSNLTEKWTAMAKRLEEKYYKSVKRYSGRVFLRQRLRDQLSLESEDDYWNSFTKGGRVLSRSALANALSTQLNISAKPELVSYLMEQKDVLERSDMEGLIRRLNYFRHHHTVPHE